MSGPNALSNGVVPVTIAPPPDGDPTDPGYGTTIGAIEQLSGPGGPVFEGLLAEGVLTYSSTYEFQEYVLEVINEVLTKTSLNNQTIDWGSSSLARTGTLDLIVGTQAFYDLVGKKYSNHQYTMLDFSIVLDDNGTPKSGGWSVRMKHY